MRPCKSKVTVREQDPKSFGKFEPGNKVYFAELEEYFSTHPAFVARNQSFLKNLTPQFKVL